VADQLSVRATYIGGPTLLLEVGQLRILTDPTFDPGGTTYRLLQKLIGPALRPEELGPIDAVLLSHDQHADNLDGEGRGLLPRAKRVITTASGAGRLGGNAVGLAPWQSVDVGRSEGRRLTATGTPARHGPPGCEPVMGDVVGFVLAWEDDPRGLYVSGDTVWYEGVAEVAERFSIDVAILHLGDAHVEVRGPDRLTMNAEEGVTAARALRPRTIVPVHYEGWAHFQEPKAHAQAVFSAASLASRVLWLEPGVPTSLSVTGETRAGSPGR